jgi:hypothetical protein
MLDLNNLTNLATEAEKIATNPMAQQVLSNPMIAGVVDQIENLTGRDLNGNGTVGHNLEDINEDDEDDTLDNDDDNDDGDKNDDFLENEAEEKADEQYTEPTETPTEDDLINLEETDDDSEPMIDA